MAASCGELLQSLFNHIALPPHLPGRQDTRIDRIEHALVERLLDATVNLSRLSHNDSVGEWESLRRSLETCRRVNSRGRLTKASLVTALRELQGRDFIALHIAEQNAALIIRLQEDGKSVLFEAFEASPLSEDVLASKNALLWDFPGSAVAIPVSEYYKTCFQDELAKFLDQASIESIKRFAARTNKAGSLIFESRNAVDPALVTQMLMTLLEVNGRRVFPPLLQKRVRDDVCWSDGSETPWRRSPFWLVLRVAVHRHLSIALGSGVGRIHYKFLICLTLSCFLSDCLGQIGLDLAVFLKTKLCRRLVKLEVDKDRSLANLSIHYKYWLTALGPDMHRSISTATNQINASWEGFKKRTQRRILTLPKHADLRHLSLSLPRSKDYIQSVLSEPFYRHTAPPSVALYNLPQEYQCTTVPKPGTAFSNRYFGLSEIETEIEIRNSCSAVPDPATDILCKQRCIQLARKIEDYLVSVGDAYDNNPEQKSAMLLTVMELWVAMDACAAKVFSLLGDYNPGIPSDILDVLQIARFQDMLRLHKIREYLQRRHAACRGSQMTIFEDPGKGCFQERYYDESDDCARLRALHQRIEAAAERARMAKEQEWREKSLEFDKLSQKAFEASCLFTTDEFLVRTHDDRHCTKCYLSRRVHRFRMDAHEHPLPADPVHAKTVVFELSCPKAFAAYRDCSWQIISTLAFPTVQSSAFEPRVLLGDYTELKPYTNLKASTFSLASRTKSFLKTHYASTRFPVGIEDICLPNGLKLRCFDTRLKAWPAELRRAQEATLAHHCQLTVPANSPFSSLNLLADFAMGLKEPSSYEIIASQSKCPSGLNVHEYMSFQTLCSGKFRRWPQILVELGSSNLNFSTEVTTTLMTLLALRIGPGDNEDPLGAVHGVFRDEAFCRRLADQLHQRLDGISFNWRETNCMETLITIAHRLFQLGGSVSVNAIKLLEKARAITSNWIPTLRSEIQTATDAESSRRCSQYALWAALLCRRTFALYENHRILGHAALRSFVECSISLQENMVSNPAMLPLALKNALIRDFKMVYGMRFSLKHSLEASQDSLISSITNIWPDVGQTQSRKFSRFEFLPDPDQWWVQIIIDASSQNTQQSVHFNLLEGHLLVMGKPIGKLPPEWRTALVLQKLFGNQSLLTYPSSLPGMTYMLTIIMNGHQIHLGFRNGQVFVRARVRDTVLELIPPQVFGTLDHFDLPASLVDNCVHWLDLKTRVIEIRQLPNIWKSKQSNWLLDFSTGRATRRTSMLVDPHSLLFQRIARTFDHFENRRNLTAFQPRWGRLTVELRRLELSFFVNGSNFFESPQLRSEIDPNQDAGTWYGLDSKLVLREVVKARDPVTQYRSSVPQRQRSILVPMGKITFDRKGPHISLFVANGGEYAKFTINDVLGRLDCPAEPRLLYLKTLCHAYTSFVLPDPLTGRTGTEEALHSLKSGCYQPWTPVTPGPYESLQLIAKLTPRREYYPKDMKVMQTIFWNPRLTTAIQHDGYWTIVNAILEKSKKLSLFSLQQIQLPSMGPVGEAHLVLRSRLRRETYQRPSSDSDGLQPAKDEPYTARDRWRVCQERTNVVECTNFFRLWPSALPTTRDLAGILQNWPNIGGYNGCFGKVLLTDLLDVQWATDWGSLVNICRECSSKDVYRLMFLFAIMSFRHDVVMDVLRTLVAFTVLQDLKVLSPPTWPAYSQFRQNQVIRIDYLLQLMKSSLVPYGGDVRSTFAFNLDAKLRRKLESAELAHEKQQEADSKALAEFLFNQWPCAEPTIEGFPMPTSFLVDVENALQVIRPEWLRLFQNLEHSEYLSQVQRVLDCHHANLHHLEETPVLGFGEQEILPCHSREGTFPTLQKLLSKAIGDKPRNPTLFQSRVSKRPASKELSRFVSKTSDQNLDDDKPQKLAPALSPEIQELEAIAGVVAQSKSAVRRQYGEDLFQSLKDLGQFKSASQRRQHHQVNAIRLDAEITQARSDLQSQLDLLQKSLERGESAHWLQQGGLWPSVTPVTLLENLRSTSSCEFGYGTKNVLLSYAQSITALQRLLRMDDALQKGNTQRLVEEQENLGHSNWKPLDYPDWLLLEIDSNMLIRPGQVDVSLATISPESGSNSVLQMNMGQGKTSCIMPMVAAVLADGSNLLRVVVPKPLLLQTAQLLHARLGGLLGRELRHIPFSRKTPTRSATIETFHRIHRDIQKSSGVLLALPEHILSFMLSGLQRLSDASIPEAASMIKVQNWLTRRARDVLDECDNILALRTQLIYPSGSQKIVDGHPHRWEIAEALLGRVDGHLYNLHKRYPHSIEIVRREQGGFPVVFFLRKDVEDELLSQLVNDIYHGRISILPECSKSDRLSIKKFISEAKVSPEVAHWISKFSSEKPAFRQAVYLLRGLLVHRILLMTLKKRWNVQYGLHPTRDPISVPYHAKGTPSDQAEWGHPDVAILFTCLAFYYGGLNLAHLRQTLEYVLKSDDPSQVYDRFSQNSSLPDSLREWKAINVDDEAQLKEIWQNVRYSVVVIDYFLNTFVFPRHAKQFQVKLQASGWDIPLFCTDDTTFNNGDRKPKFSTALTTGFSGTNDWKGMLPLTISQHDLPGMSHTNAEVLAYLLQPRNRKYVLAATPGVRHISEHELLRKIYWEGIRVLIDAGAQILEMDNLSLVKAWLEIDHEAPAAIYFDQNNKPQVWYRQGHRTPLVASPYADDLGECLVYLDEAHTRGTDLKLSTNARGALTLGLGQTKDHTVQAAMRLRQLGTSQSITFFAPPEVHQSILDLCKKRSGDFLCSYDVIRWLLEQTCSGIEQLQPLYYSQGADFCRRAQAALNHPEFVADPRQRDAYLVSLRQIEQQSLEQLYGHSTKAKSSILLGKVSPRVAVFMKELNARRKGFLDTGNAVHGSALQEVEQEREVAYEVETVREVQKPVHYSAFTFPGLHRDIVSFAKTGRLAAASAAYEQAFLALGRTAAGRKHGVSGNATSGRLYVSTEFTKTVNAPSGRPHDQFQRQVDWILWSTSLETALIIIPEEAEHLLPLVRESESPPTHVLTYAAPVTRKMLHFNHLKYYAVPSLPSDWEAPLWLRIELGIYSGRLYFEYPEYNSLLGYLGVREGTGKIAKGDVDDVDDEDDVPLQVEGVEEELETCRPELDSSNPEQLAKSFTRKPLTFLQEWLTVRRKGQDFAHTPMGFVCQGKPLLESHPFFLRPNDSEQIQKEVPIKRAGATSGDDGGDNEEDEVEVEAELCDEEVYTDHVVGGDVDDFNDADLLDEEEGVVEDDDDELSKYLEVAHVS